MLNFLRRFLNLEYYTSPLDEFLKKIRNTKLSASQQKEKSKYDRINSLRDKPQSSESGQSKIWSNF